MGWDFVAVDRWGIPIDILGASNADVIEGTNLTRYMTPANMSTIVTQIASGAEEPAAGSADDVTTNIPILSIASTVETDVNDTSPGIMMPWNWQIIQNAASFDHDTSAPTKIPVKKDGLYHLTGVITLENTSVAPYYRCLVTIYHYNSSDVSQGTNVTEQGFLYGADGNYYMAISLDWLLAMSADDYLVIGIERLSTEEVTGTHTYPAYCQLTLALMSTLIDDIVVVA